MTRHEFAQRLRKAIAIAKGARINGTAVGAQAALESGWGASALTVAANNLFGIKAHARWSGDVVEFPTWEWAKGRGWFRTVATWRKYPSWNECIVDYARIIRSLSWYRDALPHADPPHGDGDPVAWIQALLPRHSEPGWATDPDYLTKVARVGRQIASAGGADWPRQARPISAPRSAAASPGPAVPGRPRSQPA